MPWCIGIGYCVNSEGMKSRQMRRTDPGLHGRGNQVAPQTAVSQPVMPPGYILLLSETGALAQSACCKVESVVPLCANFRNIENNSNNNYNNDANYIVFPEHMPGSEG